MCGITAIINKADLETSFLARANRIVAHRGSDDEGFLLWRLGHNIRLYAGKDVASASKAAGRLSALPDGENRWKVGLGHRRLSILDLSPLGRQPMTLDALALTYNGEVYNYLEIREDLKTLGHVFKTGTDTEVILHAWQEWGAKCLERFNGMFAFVILDSHRKKLYAVRDRFGVKPLYYTEQAGYVAFASEAKQLRLLPDYRFKLNENIALDYLRDGLIDHTDETFETQIQELPKGSLLEVDLQTDNWIENQWYHLQPQPWTGDFPEACEKFYALLDDSVRLRMRSDVPVGSALSGGLDSSTIVCLMRKILESQNQSDHLIKTVTSCYIDKKYDEWAYAEKVAQRTKARPYRVFPSFDKLLKDFDRMLWHMDYPFRNTSQFSQWCVFEGAAAAGLKVMINGQGADEQLAGYVGNETRLFTGLIGKGKWLEFFREVAAYKRYYGHYPSNALREAIKYHTPNFLLDQAYQSYRLKPAWLKKTHNRQLYQPTGSLKESLCRQVIGRPLPGLLRYEDRNSMAFSIESRVPFMDHRLIEFTLGLPENFVYRRGVRKYILRKAFAGAVPDEVLARRDKMGFVSPEERWLKEEGRAWFIKEMEGSAIYLPDFIDHIKAREMVEAMVGGKKGFSFSPWHILSLNRFIKMLTTSKVPMTAAY